MSPTKPSTLFLDILQTVGLAVGIFALVYFVFFRPHQVRGESMLPNFIDNEYLLTSQLSYRFGSPKRGDVVIFVAPPAPTEDYIKRVVGVPGDKVMIKENKVFVNGEAISEPYLEEGTQTYPGREAPDGVEITVPDGEYFVLGDNRTNSSDSRAWGTVKRKKIVGKAWLIYWPPQKAGFVPNVAY